MGPMKKSKSVNKGFTHVDDFSRCKDEKSKQKKRKLSTMLGPQWSKLELERFYDAYRKYGRDWKKVAGFVRSRSIDMVEALYSMNRAYLSLPEGTASVVGLIAMMTDHYNVMGGSVGERDSDDHTIMAQKLPKYPKPKVRIGPPKEDSFQSQFTGSSDRCMSLLKKHHNVIQPYFPVRKRTPRVPISNIDNLPNQRPRGSAMNVGNVEVSCGALLMTEKARQTPSSPHVLGASCRDTELGNPTQNSARAKGHSNCLVEKPPYKRVYVNEGSADGSLGSNEVKNGDLVKDSVDSFIPTVELKRGKTKRKKEDYKLAEAEEFNLIPEADPRTQMLNSEAKRKRNKKLMFEDERTACDALTTLAEMSLMMPTLAADLVEDDGESVGKKARSDVTVRDEGKKDSENKCKSGSIMVQKIQLHTDNCIKPAEDETLADEEVNPAVSNGHIPTLFRSFESSMRSLDVSSNNDKLLKLLEVNASSSHVHPVTHIVNPGRRNMHRKRDRTVLHIEKSYAPSACSSECMSSIRHRVQCLKEKFSHCLSWHDLRRWCIYEWFYSAIDYPWFAKREFVEYLDHVGLGHVPRLTRVEWGVIRSSLGKPRRFSERFLLEEREKLKQYRESVRTHYANLRAGRGEGLPTDLAKPLIVGQQVVAIHPKTKEIHNGSVVTVDHHSCLVQFDTSDLGVESVMDIDCMPLNPVENIPEALRKPNMSIDPQHSQGPSINGIFTLVSDEHVKNVESRLCPPNTSFTTEAKVKPASTVSCNGSLRTSCATQNQFHNMACAQTSKDDMRPINGLRQSSHEKALEQHKLYPGNPLSGLQSAVKPAGLNETINSLNNSSFSCQETASGVAEVVKGSRDKAYRMVETAIKEMSLMKSDENAFRRIGEALDAPSNAYHAMTCKLTTVEPSNTDLCLPHHGQVTHFASKTQLGDDASMLTSANGCAESDQQAPSNLITSCVATLLMIQRCTERQFPPAEVAQILDNAVTSLQPCCSQNISIYKEIQLCMGRIKTQILALVPT